MPITPAHAAAAWPIHRAARRLPLAALVIGTFAPDLEYLFRLRPVGKFGHSPVGLVVFCIPITLLAYWGWRAWVRPALVPLLPAGLRPVVEADPPGRRSDLFPLAVVAALAGAATHVFWDGFTHGNGWGAAFFPVLLERSRFGGLQWFSLAQYLSSVVGMLVIAAWIALTLRSQPAEARRFAPGERARLVRAALYVAAVALAAAVVNGLFAPDFLHSLGRMAIGGEIGVALGLVSYAFYARP